MFILSLFVITWFYATFLFFKCFGNKKYFFKLLVCVWILVFATEYFFAPKEDNKATTLLFRG